MNSTPYTKVTQIALSLLGGRSTNWLTTTKESDNYPKLILPQEGNMKEAISIHSWQVSGISAEEVLYHEILKKNDEKSCDKIIGSSKEGGLSDLSIVGLLDEHLYPYREAALMIRSEEALKQEHIR